MQSRALAVTFVLTLAAVASALIISACGGGGGAATPPQPSPSPTLGVLCHFSAASTAAVRNKRIGNYNVRPVAREPLADAVAPGVVSVRFSSQDGRTQSDAAMRIGGRVAVQANPDGVAVISLPAGADPRAAASTLRAMPGVLAAGPVLKRYTLDVIPNDPNFGTLPYTVPNPAIVNPPIQWDMYRMNMPAAWGLPTGFGSSTIKIAIIDTGYDLTNQDLKPGVSRVAKSVVYDLGTGNPDTTASVQDGDGHGSDVSGIAAADTNNGTDIAGVAGNVKLLEARVFPTPSAANPAPVAMSNDVGAAIHWAVMNGANVISMSLGSSSPDNVYEEPQVAAAIAAGVTVVAAAGNSATSSLDYPAADPGVIAVGASALCDSASARNYQTSFEYVASYSNYVSNPQANQYYVVAPGGDVSSMQANCSSLACIDFLQWVYNLDSNTAYPPQNAGELILIVGTSQATPHVAGLAALMLSKHPGLAPSQVASIISTSTVSINDARQGHGRVDAFAALNNTPP